MNERKMRFEGLVAKCKNSLERFVFYKIQNKFDAEDILQEIYISAYKNFDCLKDDEKFKAWILSIARNKCNDYYRLLAKSLEIHIENNHAYEQSFSVVGLSISETVEQVISDLADKDKKILHLFYFQNKTHSEIAKLLNIPSGTVKSRLYVARANFKKHYTQIVDKDDYIKIEKEKVNNMKKNENLVDLLPQVLPEIVIKKLDKKPFEFTWEELPGYFIVPKLNQKLAWAMYDYPMRKISNITCLEAGGKVLVHGIEGIEINCEECSFVGQLTQTHTRYLMRSYVKNSVKKIATFLDEDFITDWGYGEDNCGREIEFKHKGLIDYNENCVSTKTEQVSDIVGRYEVVIGDKIYDTVLVMEINPDQNGVMTMSFLDDNGRTMLWRRYNKDDWGFNTYGKKWTEKLPDNHKIKINDDTFVHWYDCVTSYLFEKQNI